MSWQVKIEDFVTGEDDSSVNDLVTGLGNGEVRLLAIIEALGPHLTSKDTQRRCRATRLLSELVHRLPKHALEQQEVAVLVTFFCDRLKDHHSVTPHVLYGLNALGCLPQLLSEDLQTVIRSIFREVHIQTLAQADRRMFYTMLEHVLSNRLADLSKLGVDMVYGFMQAMDAEKDPRNLLIAFRCASLIAQHFPVGMCAEEFFEVVSCYFPIDFTPPPNDPHGISKQDLVVGLRNTFASSSKFAEFALPLLLEKLQSTIVNSKVDSLHTLAACAEIYGSKALQEYVNSFFSCIRREVFSGVSEVIERASLAALTSITRTLTSTDGSSAVLDQFLEEIFQSLKKHLSEPEMSLMYPSGKLLQAAGAGSEAACIKIINLVIPLLQDQFVKHPQTQPKRNILDLVNNFITLEKNVILMEISSPLKPYKEALYTLYVSVLTGSNSQLKLVAGQGLVAMVRLEYLLSHEDVETIVSHLTNNALTDNDNASRTACIQGLAAVSQVCKNDEMVLSFTTSHFVSSLREEPMEVGGGETAVKTDRTTLLEGLVTLSTTFPLVQANTTILMDHLASFVTAKDVDGCLRETKTIFQCVQRVLDSHVSKPECLEMFKESVLLTCWRLALQACTKSTNSTRSVLLDHDVIHLMAGLCRTVGSFLTDSGDVVKTICQMISKDEKTIVQAFETLSRTSVNKLLLMPLFNATVCCTKEPLPRDQCEEILRVLQDTRLSGLDPFGMTAVVKCMAALLNKIPPGDNFEKWNLIFQDQATASSRNSADTIASAHLLVWICKASVMCGHKSQQFYINELLNGLKSQEVADICAQGFGTVLEVTPDILNSSTHANVKLMYKQRFFVMTLPTLLESFNAAPPELKQYYLKALSCHLKHVPKEAVLPELPKLLPLLIQSLGIEEVSLQVSTISTFVDLIEHSPQLLTSHVDDIVPRLLKLSKTKGSMELRVIAHKCLGSLTTLPHHIIFPHQNAVIKSLAATLDDHKRLVRKEAVKARSGWFLIGSAT